MKTKFTKIVATVSDRRCDVDFIKQLAENGLNVVRMNSAHIQREGFQRIVNNVRAVSDRIGILMDTKGPEIRTTTNVDDENLSFSAGDKVCVTGAPDELSDKQNIHLSYPDIANDVKAGMHLLIDDGELDFIAHSFVRSRQDVLDIQKILDANNSPIKIISKIENQEGIDNIDEILEVSYGIMIARGDLGIEVPAERIPVLQRQLISKCVNAHKPVIVATQMLHTMISNPRPTRAEVSDIANAVFQRADALMLSGETAYGKYPVEAISTMSKIIKETEMSLSSRKDAVNHTLFCRDTADVTTFLAHGAVDAQYEIGAKAIVTDSYTGRTARYIASFRGISPTLAICYRPNVPRLLALSYGVYPMYQKKETSSRAYLYNGLEHLIELNIITPDDKIAYLGGGFGEGKGTTFLEINRVADVLENYDHYDLPNLENPEK